MVRSIFLPDLVLFFKKKTHPSATIIEELYKIMIRCIKKDMTVNYQILAMKQLITHSDEYKLVPYMIFIDLKMASDSIYKEKLYKDFTNLDIPPKLIPLIKISIESSEGKVSDKNIQYPHII